MATELSYSSCYPTSVSEEDGVLYHPSSPFLFCMERIVQYLLNVFPPDGVFLPCDHWLDFDINQLIIHVRIPSINQSSRAPKGKSRRLPEAYGQESLTTRCLIIIFPFTGGGCSEDLGAF